MADSVLSVAEVAERLGLTRTAILYRLQAGFFPNAQQVGALGFWVIPASDLEGVERGKHPHGQRRVRLTQAEYAERDLDVIAHYRSKPPVLRCRACSQTWHGWAWQCPNGCNEHHPQADPHTVANPELRAARKAAGLSQKDLAQAVGVSTSAVSSWERAGTIPEDPDVAQAVVDLLGASVWGDRIVPGRHGERMATSKLTAEDVRNIRQAFEEGQTYADLARRYKVNPNTIGRVVRRDSWKHID